MTFFYTEVNQFEYAGLKTNLYYLLHLQIGSVTVIWYLSLTAEWRKVVQIDANVLRTIQELSPRKMDIPKDTCELQVSLSTPRQEDQVPQRTTSLRSLPESQTAFH